MIDRETLDRLASLREHAGFNAPTEITSVRNGWGSQVWHLVAGGALDGQRRRSVQQPNGSVLYAQATADYLAALIGAAEGLIADSRDLFAEVGRLHGVEFIHRGCETLRAKDNSALIEQRDEARAERDRLGRQQQALLALCASAEATGRLIHHGQVHDLLITDPGDAA